MTHPLVEQFSKECNDRAAAYPGTSMANAAAAFMNQSTVPKYSYNFTWMGRPIIQYPQDMVAVQEIVWEVKPDLIIETGIAHGGSLIMNASLLAMIEYCEAVESGQTLDPASPKGKVLAIDIDIRDHNRAEIESHPMSNRIEMIQGSSIDSEVIDQVKSIASGYQRVMVFLDSNHTHEHVLGELVAFAPLVSSGSYCVVFDTIVEEVPADLYPDRSWGPGNSPQSAVMEYLKDHSEFSIQDQIDNKLLISVAPKGYLKRS